MIKDITHKLILEKQNERNVVTHGKEGGEWVEKLHPVIQVREKEENKNN